MRKAARIRERTESLAPVTQPGNVFGCTRPSVRPSVCPIVCNTVTFKSLARKFVFGLPGMQIKFVYEGHRVKVKVKVKVTRAKRRGQSAFD